MAQIKQIRCGNVNCYLLEEHGRAILVDTGRNGYEEKILTHCCKVNVELIVLTHGHLGHAQNAAYLTRALGAPVALHWAELALIEGHLKEPYLYKGMLGMVLAEVSAKRYETEEIPEFKPEIFLKEGDSLKDYGIDARVMELPGHTRGSIGLDILGKDVIVGDALMNLFYPGLSMIYYDREEMIKSADKISALGVRKVYFGHGSPADNRAWSGTGI